MLAGCVGLTAPDIALLKKRLTLKVAQLDNVIVDDEYMSDSGARKIINDCCVPRGIPWIYGGVVQSQGMTMNIVPGGPCFACLMPGKTPKRGTYPIAGTHGILSTAAPFIAAIQATEAIKIITHGFASSSVRKTLLYVDLWDNVFQDHSIVKLPGCPVCGGKDQHGNR